MAFSLPPLQILTSADEFKDALGSVKAHHKLSANGCVLLLLEKSLLLLVQNLVLVLPHVPMDIQELLDDCNEPSLAHRTQGTFQSFFVIAMRHLLPTELLSSKQCQSPCLTAHPLAQQLANPGSCRGRHVQQDHSTHPHPQAEHCCA
jgi:hypothetical protein